MVTGKQWRFPLLGLLVLALAVLACGLPGRGDAGEAGGESEAGGEPAGEGEAGVAPVGEGETGGAPAGDEDVPLTYTGIEPGDLSSYRSQFVMTFVGTDEAGAPMDERYTVNQAFSSDPPASSFVVDTQGTGVPPGPSSFQFVQIEGTGYMLSDGECSAYTSDSVSPEDMAFSPDTFLMGSDFGGAQRVLPNETINGVTTRHYRFTENEVVLGMSGLTSFRGDIWVAVDGGYTVKQTISADGTAAAFGGAQGHLEWSYDLLDINSPVSVEPPAGCEAPASAEFPMTADAFDMFSSEGVVTYSTASSVDEVAAFYAQQMPAQGWTAGEASTDVPGLATMAFTRGGETASVLISESEGTTSVVITLE